MKIQNRVLLIIVIDNGFILVSLSNEMLILERDNCILDFHVMDEILSFLESYHMIMASVAILNK